MRKSEHQAFRVNSPYCLERRADGHYAVLNRDYQSIGLVPLPALTPVTAAERSDRGSGDLDAVYLYNDGCVPTHSASHMRAYQEKLAVLAKLAVTPER